MNRSRAINDCRRRIDALRANLDELERALDHILEADVVSPSLIGNGFPTMTEKMGLDVKYKLYFGWLCKAMETLPDADWQCYYGKNGQNWCRFLRQRDFELQNSGGIHIPEFSYDARFARRNRIVTSLVIRHNHDLYERLQSHRVDIERDFGGTLEWIADLGGDLKNRKIQTARRGTILSENRNPGEIGQWHVENLSKLDGVLTPKIRIILNDLQEEIFEE